MNNTVQLDNDEKLVLVYMSDIKKYEDLVKDMDQDDFDEILDDLVSYRLLNEPEWMGDRHKLSRRGKQCVKEILEQNILMNQKDNKLTSNEILTLRYISDGMQNDTAPAGLTQAQFCAALKSLSDKGMARVAFVEGGNVEAAQITMEGRAALDNLKDKEGNILENIISHYSKGKVNKRQYAYLKHTVENGFCENIDEKVDWHEYETKIWKPLIKNGYFKVQRDSNKIIASYDGEELVKNVEKEFAKQLAEEEPKTPKENQHPIKTSNNQEIAYGGLKIRKGHLTDVFKVLRSMWELQLFVDEQDKPLTIEDTMNAFGKFFGQEKQFEDYSSYLSGSLDSKENTYLKIYEDLKDKKDVFLSMLLQAKIHYDTKNQRKQNQ